MHTCKNVAVVGMGKMGIAHAAILNTMESVNLIGLVDSNVKLQRHIQSLGFAMPCYAGLTELFEEQVPEAVFVCTPPSSHLSIAQKCVKRGIHTFLEKPIAESLESAKKIYDLLDNRPIVHGTGYNVVYVPLFQHVHNLLRQGEIGKVNHFSAQMYLTKVVRKAQADKGWQFRPKVSGGGVLANVGSHLLALLFLYFGDLLSVESRMEKKYSSIVEDSISCKLHFKNGVAGEMDASWSVEGYPNSEIRMNIFGDKGMMSFDSEWITIQRGSIDGQFAGGSSQIHASELESRDLFTLGAEGYYAQDSYFLSCIETNLNPLVSWKEGVKVQEMIEMIYQSSLENQLVTNNG